jgi:large subunit ribosomal protein L4e
LFTSSEIILYEIFLLHFKQTLILLKLTSVIKLFTNILGVSLLCVERLNLLRLAPGGHVGRFVVWTESAFKKLDSLYGTWSKKSQKKVDFK